MNDDRTAASLRVGDMIPSHNPMCFGCGSKNENGLRMKMVVASTDTVSGEFLVRRPHQGAPGLLHGGVMVAAFDEVLGSVNWLLGSSAVTARLETNFAKPVPVDTLVVMSARIDHVDGRKVHLKGRAETESGDTLATADGLFIRVPMAHFREHGRAQDIQDAVDAGEEIWLH